MDKKIGVSNILSLFRLVSAPVVMFAIILDKMQFALILFIVAALSDLFDGYIARKFKRETKLGYALDKVADKILVGLAIVGILIKYNMILWLFVFAFIILVYILFGIEFFKKEHKPILFGRILISLQVITIVLFLMDFVYKWIILWIAVVLTAIVGFIYIYRLLKEIIQRK
ncbi:CDP-alcohol phosphatidyltransferase family protein [Candidatus Woesearchaeota archaeon]|nr:CDP-alcohol phosphatidyltransferase family protein [Candidatus Woesearchaeota archaeon]